MKKLTFTFLIIFSTQFCIAQEIEPYEKYYDNGQVKITGQKNDKKRVGNWKEFYETGEVLSEFSYKNGEKDIESKSYYKSGTIHYQTKIIDGKAVRKGFFEDGKLETERIVKTGYYKKYNNDGNLIIESNFVDFQLEGVWKRFYKNGQVEWEVEYKTDYKDGFYKNYFENGKLKVEGKLIEAKKEGKEKRYTSEGELEWEGFYLKDKLNKKWKQYNKNGKVINTIKYSQGEILNKNQDYNLTATEIPEGTVETVPIYPGCETMLNNKRRKQCLSIKVNEFVSKNFNLDLAISIPGLSGKQRILVYYTIDKDGSITNIRTKAAHPKLEEEANRVVSMLPTIIPGEQRNKPVKVTFFLPITFNIKN